MEHSAHQPEAAASEPYEAPAILDSFDAQDVLGVAYGQGSMIDLP